MFVLIFTEHAMVHFCLPNKSHKLLLCLMYSNILNAIVSFIFFSTEEDLTLAMEIAPNVIESQQPKIPKVLNVTGNITVHGQMNMMSSSVSAPEAGRKALRGEQENRSQCRMVTVQQRDSWSCSHDNY